MAQDHRIIPDELLPPVFKVRALAHLVGASLGVASVMAGNAPDYLAFVAAVVALIAFHQIRVNSIEWAWIAM